MAWAVFAGQPSPSTPREHVALIRWLSMSAANADPGIDEDELMEQVVAGLKTMADTGDQTAKAVMEARLHETAVALARTAIALNGASWVPTPPEVPEQERLDAIASTVLKITGWTSVAEETVDAVYHWLFGDEALFIMGTELRVHAGMRILENPVLHEVHVAHPDTGVPVLVTRDDVLEHWEADRQVMKAARRYNEKQQRWHGRLIRALRPYGDGCTTIGDVVQRAAHDLGIERNGRSFEEFAALVVAAAEARGGASAG